MPGNESLVRRNRLLLSVVIPVFNEARTIDELVRRVLAVDLSPDVRKEIVIVDDGSTDETPARIAAIHDSHADLICLRHQRNRGKGAALRTGFAAASGDVVLVQDADLELDPADYSSLLEPILSGAADVVYGSRFLGESMRGNGMLWLLANRTLTGLTNALCGTSLTDMETGFKVFRRRVFESMTLQSDRFTIEPEITVKLARRRVRIHEVPVKYDARSRAEGKHIGWMDGLAGMVAIVRYRCFD